MGDEFLLFAGKALVILGVIGALVVLVALLIAKASQAQELEVKPLNEHLEQIGVFLRRFRLGKDEIKAENKKRKKEKKRAQKNHDKKQLIYVLRFHGDIKASQVESLREEVTAILQASEKGDEVLCLVHSPGGVVYGYGLAAAQLLRLRDAGLRLTVAVDEVAASGGYLMACVAHEIIAAPFAIIGSIGVVAQVPNFHRFLKKNDVEYKEYTAGEFKRTVSVFGEITPKGEEKFVEQLEETHDLFKYFVNRFRPHLDIQKVATGEYWYGEKALELKLIDKIQTSDDFILEKFKKEALILEVEFQTPKTLQEKIAGLMGNVLDRTWVKLLTQLEIQKYF